jgi:hypothetical protein
VSSGIGGTLRFIGILAVLMLGGLALLAVFDLVSRDILQDWAVKLVLAAAVAVAVTVAIAALARRGSD